MAWPSDSIRSKNWGTETLTDADLEGQLDLLHTYNIDSLNSSTGHKHDATSNEGPKIALASAVSGTLPLTNGGTGQTSLATFLNLIYPVGSVYANAAVSTNPGTLLGFGTWVAIEGQCVVGLVAGGEFDVLGAVSEGETTVDATHTHAVTSSTTSNTSGGNVAGIGWHHESGTQTFIHHNTGTAASGGSATLNNIQPSYVAYVWRRTV